jgi:hypothetical protein
MRYFILVIEIFYMLLVLVLGSIDTPGDSLSRRDMIIIVGSVLSPILMIAWLMLEKLKYSELIIMTSILSFLISVMAMSNN